ncbi:MAG: PD-(D/E)XK nuclease family transposase, partial [Aeriscardovia sp.]|nr:PD-(D/E)XK nuclease family transposase [Aeriscardovia sp.]
MGEELEKYGRSILEEKEDLKKEGSGGKEKEEEKGKEPDGKKSLEEKTVSDTEQELEELQQHLREQEEQLTTLRKERDNTIRSLRKAKLKMIIPSDEARRFAKNASPMDDVVFQKLGEDPLAIEEIISTILGVPVKVKSAIPQYTVFNVGSRSVRLDNYSEIMVEAELQEECGLGEKGAIVDIEMQKSDDDDHEYRVYYNGASMIIDKTPPRENFKNLPRAIVIFISSFDVFHEGKVIYQTIKV